MACSRSSSEPSVTTSSRRYGKAIDARHSEFTKTSRQRATFKTHVGWWQNYSVDLQTIKARYKAAFEAYQVRKRNADQTSSGEKPSPADIAHEEKALRALDEARRALLAAIAKDSEGHRIRLNLERAARLVFNGERLVVRQRTTVEELRRDGHNVDLAMGLLAEMERALGLLAEMEKSLRLHIGDRDGLLQQYDGFSR
jgi:hypothetical protein